jgi:hypothetical protein
MPLQTALDNLTQKLTHMGAAAAVVGLEDHRAMLAAARRRTRDGHVAMSKAAGVQVSEEDDDVGDLTITGDIQLQKQAPPVNGAVKDLAKMLGAGAIGAGVLLGSQIAMDRQPEAVEESQSVVQPAQPDHTATIRPL